MRSVSVVELTNTFDDWRNRTNDVITEINGANSVDPTSAIVYANSTSGFQVNEVVSDSLTGTAISGTRLIFTGGNRGWIGDSPLVHLDTKKAQSYGWEPKISIEEGINFCNFTVIIQDPMQVKSLFFE